MQGERGIYSVKDPVIFFAPQDHTATFSTTPYLNKSFIVAPIIMEGPPTFPAYIIQNLLNNF